MLKHLYLQYPQDRDWETITIPSQSLGASSGGGTDPIITLGAADLQVEVIDAVVANPGSGYSVDDVVTIPGASLTGSFSDTTITLTGADIDNANVFTLETIAQGTIMNSSSSLDTNGALASGSKDNIVIVTGKHICIINVSSS